MFDTAEMQTPALADTMPRRLDGRTGNAKRVRELVAVFTGQLGGSLDALQRETVTRAAELTVAAESMRKRSLRGETIDIAELIKLENAASRAVRGLNLGRQAARKPSLREHLANRAARVTDAPSGEAA